MKIYTKRSKCRLCNNTVLNKILHLPKVAPGEQLRKNIKKKYFEVPIDLYQCQKCYHVQLLNIPKDNLMWNDEYTFMPSKNKEIVEHFKNVIDYFYHKHSNNINSVFEIGSNDGIFLKLIKKKYNCHVLGIDPSKIPRQTAKKNKIETIPEYFNYNYSKKIKLKRGSFDLIVANNVFAHSDNLDDMLKGITNLLDNKGYFIFEASYLLDVLNKKLIGTMIHEHLSIHSLTSFKSFLKKFNINLIDVIHQKNIQGGAIIGIARKNINLIQNFKISKNLLSMYSKERKNGLASNNGLKNYNNDFKLFINKFKTKINNIIKDNKFQIICYGAARSIQLTLKLLDLDKRASFVLENNKFKFNKFIPLKNSIKIIDEKSHNYSEKNFYIITAWVHTSKILQKIKSRIKKNRNIKIATIYPKFKVLNVKK